MIKNNKAIIFITLTVLLLGTNILNATTGFSFLKTGMSPRAISMGDSYSMNKFEPAAIYYNPALLGLSDRTELQFIHKEWFKDSQTEFLGFTSNIESFRLGICLSSFSIKNIELRTNPGPPEGYFTSRNAALSISTSYNFQQITVGLTSKFLYEKIHIHEASGYAFDFGVIYTPFDYLRTSISLNNLGKMNPLLNQASDLPTNLRIGGSSTFKINDYKLNLSPSIQLLTILKEKKSHLNSGIEIDYDNLFSIRFGNQTGYATHSYSLGMGICYKIFTFDYSYLPLKYELGTSHTFSIKISF